MAAPPCKGEENYAVLLKICQIIDLTKDTCMGAFGCGEEVSVDNSKQYMAAKPCAKWVVKIWSLCDSNTGYVLHFSVYIG
jgi:hypothetical protein